MEANHTLPQQLLVDSGAVIRQLGQPVFKRAQKTYCSCT
jgi:hypothetical protein